MLPPRPGAEGVPGAPPALGWQQGVQEEEVNRPHSIRMLNRRLTVFSETLCRGRSFESHDARKEEQLRADPDSKDGDNWKLGATRKETSPLPSASVQQPNCQGRGTSPIKAGVQATLAGTDH